MTCSGPEADVMDPQRKELTHAFPPIRPDIRIRESSEEIGEIDCLELRWWFLIPRVGDHTSSAQYEADTLQLSAVLETTATAPARVHGVECVEIEVNEWSAWKDWPMEFAGGVMYGRIEKDRTRWVAVAKRVEGKRLISTFRDEGFDRDWGASNRTLRDDGRYQLQADGSYRITDGQGLGAGTCDVTIGGNMFRCLRVLDPDLSVPNGGELVEAYVELGGRTIFFRRYDARFYRGADLVRKYPDNRRIVIDGTTYVHCDCTGRAHDTITSAALTAPLPHAAASQ
jgi:hypothetical protein